MSSTPSKTPRLELGERRGAAHRVEQVVDRPGVHRDHRDDLLREHVERIARIARRLDLRPRASRASTAAHATRSPRNFGKMTPRLAAPIVWPARPMRCRPLATDGGASIWTTRSIAPMSMPSSSDEVATSAAQLAGLEQVLDLDALRRARASRGARAPAVSPASSLSAPASRSARRRLLTKISVERVRAHQLQQARMDRASRSTARTGPCDAGPLGMLLGLRRSAPCPRPALRSSARAASSARRVDDRDRRDSSAAPRSAANSSWIASSRLGVGAPLRRLRCARPARGAAAWLRRRRGSARPRRAAAASPTGRCAAAARVARSASSRSSDSARCAPRLVGTSAWISSMITVSTDAQRLARVRRQQQVERLGRRDQDVGRLALEARALGRPACRRCGSRSPAA